MEQKLFTKDFTLVVTGQIISLFGNATIRFALPLYLLNQTGSSVLYGIVTASALFPTILLSPVGGMVADRVNKRNIMVILDFFTAAVIGAFSLFRRAVDLVPLMIVTMMLLYGNALYGVLFEVCKGYEYAVILFAGAVSMLIAVGTKNVFEKFS